MVSTKLGNPKMGSLRCIIVILAIMTFVLPIISSSEAVGADKKTQLSRTARELLIVGRAQYKKGMFAAAEKSLTKAQKYEDYLTVSQKQELDSLLEKVGQKSSFVKTFNSSMTEASGLADQQRYSQAIDVLEGLESSDKLTSTMSKQLAAKMKEIKSQQFGQKSKLITIYGYSVELYKGGQLAQARVGFEEIALTGVDLGTAISAEEYIAKIDSDLADIQEVVVEVEVVESIDVEDELLNVEIEAVEVVEVEVEPVAVADDADIKGSYIDKVNQKRRIQQSYTKAVVDDALNAAEMFKASGEFDEAKAKLAEAQTLVEKNKLALGDEFYKDYSVRLSMISTEIAQQQNAHMIEVQKDKLRDGQKIADQFRQQQELSKQNRIAELLENARLFQKQQRYDEALKQIQLLLSIDPLNDIALMTKMLLEDTISFRREIEIRNELNKEEVGSLQNVIEATIPYDKDIVYSKKWREISSRRARKTEGGVSSEDAATYEQLASIVDISSLTAETPIDEAIDIIRNSVDPALKIVVLWGDLSENAYIDQTTPINMRGVPAIPLKKALDLLLNSVSGGLAELTYIVEDGIVTVATKGVIKVNMTTEVYDVSELLLPKSSARFNQDDLSEISSGTTSSSSDTGDLDENDQDSEQQIEESADSIMSLITDSIDPDSWYDNGGNGSIRLYSDNRLIVTQTPEVQKQVFDLIKSLKKSLGIQVAIEARFLLVKEDFLENINLDVDFSYDFGDKLGIINFDQSNLDGFGDPSMKFSGSYGGPLDDLQVNFLVSATQKYSNSRTVNAPKVTVISGESASIRIKKQQTYIEDYDFENITSSGDNQNTTIIADPQIGTVSDGIVLNVTPTVSEDRKYVLLQITSTYSQADLSNTVSVFDEEGNANEITTPTLDTTSISTRVSVPDQGTLLIGGQKLNFESENEKGVPILSKLPFGIGRLFKNNNSQTSQDVLLILVKPIIIIQSETEEDAFSAI